MFQFTIAMMSFLAGGVVVLIIFVSSGRKLGTVKLAQLELDAERRQIGRDEAKLAESAEESREQLRRDEFQLAEAAKAFEEKAVSYTELHDENQILKRDLRNIDIATEKIKFDLNRQKTHLEAMDTRGASLAEKYLNETEKWVGSAISANNYASCKKRLTKAIEWCCGIGFDVSVEREEQLLSDLKTDFEKEVRAALEREEQSRIKAIIREEEAREREIEKELKILERQRLAIQAALDKALAETQEEHSEEVERLRARLAEAEEQNERVLSQAQLTKAGHIYVVSNIGSFGDDVMKIGMTRRLKPMDRVKELSDASVPFPFDVHMMISCNDAPTLEKSLHLEFRRHRVNKVNPRKEFFRIELEQIRRFVETNHGAVDYIVDAEALEYRQSLELEEDDQDVIETVFKQTEINIGLADGLR